MSRTENDHSLYDILADNYSSLFPLDPARVQFVQSSLGQRTGKILDLGCATGDLACALAAGGYRVTGVDLNAKMIELAAARARQTGLAIAWYAADMLAFMRNTGEAYNAILCFGNTLPHLPDPAAVREFFTLARRRLAAGGVLLIQILNYDKILREQRAVFPLIETETLRFERYYTIGEEITFHIKLWDKARDRLYEDTTRLLPLRKEQLATEAAAAGFTRVKTYADYRWTPADGSEWATLYHVS